MGFGGSRTFFVALILALGPAAPVLAQYAQPSPPYAQPVYPYVGGAPAGVYDEDFLDQPHPRAPLRRSVRGYPRVDAVPPGHATPRETYRESYPRESYPREAYPRPRDASPRDNRLPRPPAPVPYGGQPGSPEITGSIPFGGRGADPSQTPYDRDVYRGQPGAIVTEPLRPPLSISPASPGYAQPGYAPPAGGTRLAALPPEDQPEEALTRELPTHLRRQLVAYPTREPAGTIVVDTGSTHLYLVLGSGQAMRYGIGVGREGFTWSGTERVSRMAEWPDWHPPAEMIERQPYLPRFMAGGPGNPMGARALYLGKSLYRIHGTNQPSTIGQFVSSGCIRLLNEDIEDLYSRVTVGTRVVVLPGRPGEASIARPPVR